MVSIKQLSYALAVEKTLHFKKAAELCCISQSALSNAVSELEHQVGLEIFERNNKKVLVTSIGREVLLRAKKILMETKDLQHLCDNKKAPLSFPLTIGMIPTIAPYLLPQFFIGLKNEFPKTQINIVEERSAVLIEMVRDGQIDTALIALPYDCNGLLTLEFWQEDFYWISLCSKEYSEKKEITSEEINPDKLMLLKEGHCLKDHILDVCKLTNQIQDTKFGTNNLNTLVQLVLAGQGSTLIPAMSQQQLLNDCNKLSAIHLNEPSPHRRIAFIFRPNYNRLSCLDALSVICKKAFSK
jgi:LysR family hydrogen peroxide-inducible transcriptional activator